MYVSTEQLRKVINITNLKFYTKTVNVSIIW